MKPPPVSTIQSFAKSHGLSQNMSQTDFGAGKDFGNHIKSNLLYSEKTEA